MAEYIECRNCDSTDCKGCNLKNLETMLTSGKFNCLMNRNHSINPAVDVALVRHGRWLPQVVLGQKAWDCSECKTLGSPQWKWCPVCGAKMDEARTCDNCNKVHCVVDPFGSGGCHWEKKE